MGEYFIANKQAMMTCNRLTRFLYEHSLIDWETSIKMITLVETDVYETIKVVETIHLVIKYLTINPELDMNVQDKIGRDRAKELLSSFQNVHQDDPEKIEIFKNTKLYKFFMNKPTLESTECSHVNLPRMRRDVNTAKILFIPELALCLDTGVITVDQHEFASSLLESNDEGDFAILEGSINVWRDARKKKERNKK